MPGRPKVDPEKVRRLHAQGVSVNGIAERTGCSKGSVYNVLKLKTKEGSK
jgi:DNA invertase Pin-like site-specific DNA recombinase